MRLNQPTRSGVTVVECALVYPAVFLFVVGLIVGGIGVFRYQELASLARRAARYAAVHGQQYEKDTGAKADTPAQIFERVVVPHAVALDGSRLDYAITYNKSNNPTNAKVVNGAVVFTTNTVSVTLSYRWLPEAFLGGLTLKSTSVMPMAY